MRASLLSLAVLFALAHARRHSARSAVTGYGITYSPYHNDGTCKTQNDVNIDFAAINGYTFVRIYNTDCNQVVTVNSTATAKGMKLFVGINDITQVSSGVQTIIAANCLKNIDTVAVGNEGINSGVYSVQAVVSAISTARSMLKNAGYTGRNSDYAAANVHAYFNGDYSAQNAGTFVLQQFQRVTVACGGKYTMITETGWPTKGITNNQAVASSSNQAAAIASIKSALSGNLILYDMYNVKWQKDSPATYNTTQHWGIYGDAPSS